MQSFIQHASSTIAVSETTDEYNAFGEKHIWQQAYLAGNVFGKIYFISNASRSTQKAKQILYNVKYNIGISQKLFI